MTKPATHHSRLMTISAWLKANTEHLRSAGIESAQLDCKIILENVLQKNRSWIAAHSDEVLYPMQIQELNKFVTQRQNRIPLAYILGSKEFYGRDFFVNNSVLVPRPESEEIIEMLKTVCNSYEVNTIIDVGTGSGCLAITAKCELPDVHVTAIDNSPTALRIARKNATVHKVQVQFKQIDIFKEGLPKMPKTRPYILAVNLPYVPDSLVTSEEITKEPAEALFSGQEGLDHYRQLANVLKETQNKPFAIITESLANQHEKLIAILAEAGYKIFKTKDLIQLFKLS